jgi:hypothetical protein
MDRGYIMLLAVTARAEILAQRGIYTSRTGVAKEGHGQLRPGWRGMLERRRKRCFRVREAKPIQPRKH